MTADSAKPKTFMLALDNHYIEYFRRYAFVYRHLLERLGPTTVHELWEDAMEGFVDELFAALLSTGWTVSARDPQDIVLQRNDLVEKLFAAPIQGVDAEGAMSFLLGIGPFKQFEASFPNLSVQRESTTYEALHLLDHGMALFAEAAISRIGKAAEFMIYDALLEEVDDRLTPEITGREWLKAIHERVQSAPEKPAKPAAAPSHTIGSAGHVEEVVRVEEDETVLHMTQCSWADYYLERHPAVGQLLGCCIDDPVYRRTARGLRLQRLSTLMEGGPYCDFRFHSVDMT